MQKGDLSHDIVPRILLVFEGAVAFLPDDKRKAFDKAYRKQRWTDALALWELNELMLRKIWDITFRKSLTVELVTFLGQGMADVLAARMDEEDMPIARVWATTPGQLSRRLAYMPNVSVVYDPDENHVFTYGSKGKVITDVNQLGE